MHHQVPHHREHGVQLTTAAFMLISPPSNQTKRKVKINRVNINTAVYCGIYSIGGEYILRFTDKELDKHYRYWASSYEDAEAEVYNTLGKIGKTEVCISKFKMSEYAK